MSRVARMSITMTIGAALAVLALAPAAGAEGWSAGPDLPAERTQAATATLHDGRVLAIGGAVLGGAPGVASSIERFDPSTSAWTGGVHDMDVARYAPVAVTLADGRVLVAGGVGSAGVALTSAELYDPAANHWTPTANEMSAARVGGGLRAAATLLPGGKVLLAGSNDLGGSASADVDVFDPETDTFTAVQSMNHARVLASQTLLKDGRVLVAGGVDGSTVLDSAEVYDPAHDTWTDVANAMAGNRAASLLVTLPSGQALIGGGITISGGAPAASTGSELYDPASNRFSAAGAMHAAHFEGAVVALPDGRVVAAGGTNLTSVPPALPDAASVAEIYQPATNTWTLATPMPKGVLFPAAAGLPDGRVLIAGGNETVAPVDDTQIYTPPEVPSTIVTPGGSTTPPATAPWATAPPRVPAVVVPKDTTAPRVKITGLKRKLKRKTLLRGLRFKVTPSERARLQIRLLGVKKKTKHKKTSHKRATSKHAKRSRYTVKLASKSFALGGRHRLKLKPKRSRLSHAKRFKIRLRIVATDAAGNHRTTTRTIDVSR